MEKKRGYGKKRTCFAFVLIFVVLFESIGVNVSVAAATVEEDSLQKELDDLIVSSSYVLEEDLVVRNLIAKGWKIDLNGHQLRVLGEIIQTGGDILFNKGELLCEGDYTLNGGRIRMENGNDYLKVGGRFLCQTPSVGDAMSAGTIEITGDFVQKQAVGMFCWQNFICTGTHRVIFSGTKRQSIHFDSPASHFNHVILKNTSEEGIYSDTLINSLSMERNSTQLTIEAQGEYGWTLEEDQIYDGDLCLIGDTLDLNGHSLHIKGNLYHMNGGIEINGGSLIVDGDFRLQQKMTQTVGSGVVSSFFSMKNPEDRIKIGGDFVTESIVDHSAYLQQGVLEVKGNVEQKGDIQQNNLVMSSDSTLCLSGTKKQRISMESSGVAKSRLANLEVVNSQGIELVADTYISGNVSDYGNPVSGKYLVIHKEATFTNGSFTGNIRTEGQFVLQSLHTLKGDFVNSGRVTLGTDLMVEGNFDTQYGFVLDGHKLEVSGDITMSGDIQILKGRLSCGGDFNQASDSLRSTLLMIYEEDYVLVKGNFYANARYASGMSAGTLELKGDFVHTVSERKDNFCASRTHVTVFSGDSRQTVTFASEYSYFNHVEILNESEEGVYAPNGINCSSINRNGNKITTDRAGEFGWKLTEDENYKGDLYLISGELDLNGHTLTVEGNLIQSAGTVNVNGGKLVIQGDYRIQAERRENEIVTYDGSIGYLQMTKQEDQVLVEGDFIMGSVHSHTGKLSAGKLLVKGDVSVIHYKEIDNFVTTESHVLILAGQELQKVDLAMSLFNDMGIANLKLANESTEGIVLETVLRVKGEVSDNANKITGCILISSQTSFKDGRYSGDVMVTSGGCIKNLEALNGNLIINRGGSITLQNDLSVSGGVSIQGSYLNVAGNELRVGGDVTITAGHLQLSKGACICEGDMILEYNSGNSSALIMKEPEDYVCVNGNFSARSRSMSSAMITKGTLELKGDFEHKKMAYDDEFIVSGESRVILSGTKLQTVTFDSKDSYFSYVEILNTSEEGVYSEEGIHCQYLETNGNVYRTGKEGTTGWTLRGDEKWEGDLVLTTGTLDLQGHELIINGNLIQKGGNVKISGGTLRVNGNYLIGETTDVEQEGITGSWAALLMQRDEDTVYVQNDFVMASYIDHSTYLTAGALHVRGDLSQRVSASKRNLATTSGFTLILEGTDMQNITMETPHTSYSMIANLVINNTSEKGVFLDGMLVTGEVTVTEGSSVHGELDAVSSTVFLDEWYTGDVAFYENTVYTRPLKIRGYLNCQTSFSMKADVAVEGNLRTGGMFELNANTLRVSGDINVNSSRIRVGEGKVFCGGTLYLEYCSNSASGIEMTEEKGYVLVEGDVEANSASWITMTKGTLEIRGDFIQNRFDAYGAFRPSEDFVVLLSGQEKQRVFFADPASGFGTLRIKNESAEGVYFENDSIRAIHLERNGCLVTWRGKGTYGWTLSEDMVLEDDLYIVLDELDLNGHSLTINGNLYIGAGSVKINGGTLKISEDLRLQNYDGKGNYSDSTGRMIMTDISDRVTVGGDFIIQTSESEEGYLTAGILEIQGDFFQRNAVGIRKNSSASGTHKVEFTGEEEQTVCLESPSDFGFMDISFSEAERDVRFLSDVYVAGQVWDSCQRVLFEDKKYMYVREYSQFEKGEFSGNVSCSTPVVLQEDIRIGGTLRSTAHIDLNGHAMKVGKLEKSSGELWIHGGSLSAETDIQLTSGAYVVMKDEADRIFVKGDFEMFSGKDRSFNEFLAGKLEINGDVTIGSEGFVPEGTHQTILSGRVGATGRDYVQTIRITKENAKFNELILTKDKDRFYVFSDDVNRLCRKLTVEDSDSKTLSKVMGLREKGLESASVSLEWEAAQGDQKAEGYYIFRGSSRIGKTAETKYTDKGLKPETEYRYTVCAFDKKGNVSETSDVLTVITKRDTKAPDKPTCTKIVTRTGSSVTVGWNKAKDDVGVSKYRIYRDGKQIAEVAGDQYTYRDINRTPEEEHTYQVSALDEAENESSLSKGVKGTARMPKITKVVPEGGSELGGMAVELTAYYENVGNSTGNKVRFQYSTDEGHTWQDINISLLGQNDYNYSTLYSKCTWDISRMKKTECRVRTILYDSDNNTDQTETLYRLDTEPPFAPEHVDAQSQNGQVELSWNSSNSANCASYEVYRAEEGGSFKKIQTLKGRENTEYMDRDVTQRKIYTYYVKAVDIYGLISEESGKTTVTVSDDLENPRVLSFSASKGRLNKKAQLTVKAVDNIGIKSISVQYFDGAKWLQLGQSDAPGGIGVVCFDTMGIKDGEYKFRALAEDQNGNVSEGYGQSFTIDNTGVEKVQINEVSAEADKVRITWKAVSDEDIDYYVVEQKVGKEFSEVARESNIMGTYIKELNPETLYCFRVVGYDMAGNRGEASEEIQIRTKKDTTAPYIMKFDPVISYYRDTIPLEITAKDNIELGKMEFSCSYDKMNWEQLGEVQAPEGSREYIYSYNMDIRKYGDGALYVRAVSYDRAGNVNTKAQTIRTFYKVTTQPDPVEKIYADAKDGYIRVQWEMMDTENFASFDLYRKSESESAYKCVGKDILAHNYFDTEAKDNEEISYKVVVNDLAGNQSEFSKEVSATMFPDTEAPKVYGVSPVEGKKVGLNPEITALIADNRRLKNISVEFRRQGDGDLWTEIYNEKTKAESRILGIVWENEELDDGTYEFRVSAEDTKGNVSKEYVFSYIFDSEYVSTEISGDMSGTLGEGEKPGDTEEKEKLTVTLPEEYTLWQEKEQYFDGTNVISNADIVSWKWDFGDGHTERGAGVTYAYPETGTYTLTLTVKDAEGREASATSVVRVLSKSSGGVSVRVRAQSGTILENAQIYIRKNGEKEGKNYTGNSNGELEVALDAGTYEISAYQTGHIPLQKEVKIAPGAVRKVEFSLESNEVVTGTLTHRKLDVREIMELGVNLSDPDNWYTYTYRVVTYFRKEPKPQTHEFYVSEGKWTYVEGTSGGRSAAYTVAAIPGTDGEEHILIRYETVEYLKQMFEVELRLQNQAGKEFSLTGGTATLNLPEGLSLAGMKDRRQTKTVQVADIPGKSEETIRWYIRGDKPGEYSISAGYSGRLQPFDAPVNITIQDKEPVVVTEENTNTNTDDGFLDPNKEVVRYEILVMDANDEKVKGAYVELWYGDLSTRGITDSDGMVWLEVNKEDARTFRLTVECEGYPDYEDDKYQIDKESYYDIIRLIPKGHKAYKDKNEEYKGDFALIYASINDTDVSAGKITINTYETENNSAKLYFNKKVTEASIVAKAEDEKNFLEIASKNDISATSVTLDFQSNKLAEGYEVYVRAVDEESGTWHLYQLENVKVVYKKPESSYNTEQYSQELAEQCALYSALAYKVIEKEKGGPSDGFSFDTYTNFLSDQIDMTYDPCNQGYVDLRQKLSMDGFIIDDQYMYVNYFEGNDDEDAENNCSYSIVHRKMWNGKKIVYVIIRGTDRVEWSGNMRITGESYDASQVYHSNFKHAEELVYKNVKKYIGDNKFKDVDIVVTGHSRGAAIANLLAKDLIDGKEEFNESTQGSYGTVTAYTFATPYVSRKIEDDDTRYDSIYNFCFTDDFVPQVPMNSWGYEKYGQTVFANAEILSQINPAFTRDRLKIRSEDKSICYASDRTKELILHISENWNNVSDYYNLKPYEIILDDHVDETINLTLYQFMHNKIARAIIERKHGEIEEFLVKGEILAASLGKDKLSTIGRYFLNGSELFDNYIFDTHNIDNYYAALINDGFDTSGLNSKTTTKSKSTTQKYLSSANADNDPTDAGASADIAAFRKVLQEERDVYSADGKANRTPIYKILGWDIDDTSTWEGVRITDGAVTSIAMPLVHLGGTLDLSGLDKLESLKCIYTGFEEIKLDGCKSLKELILCDNAVTSIDLSDCDKLEYVNVSDNKLKKIYWGNYDSLTRFNCTGNYLDTDTDEELLSVITALKEKGSNPSYKNQRYDESAEFSPADIAFVKEFLAYGENEKLTGWDQDDMSTWSGIQWKTVGGMNYINRIEITRKGLTGELVLSHLKYIREVVCSGNKFTLLDVFGCSALEQLSCFGGELETLILGGNDKLLYLDCRNNCLMVEDIEAECKMIASRKGSEVYYERQYINAGRDAFCEDECVELERFAALSGNREILKWDFDRPGRIPQIQWEVCDGEYRVKEIDLAGCDVKGTLDLSGFSSLKSIGFAATKIKGIIFPEYLKGLPDNAFINCQELTEVRLPSELVSIGKTAFYNCEKLERIDLPDGLEEIQDEAFTNCKGLTEIIFGKNLKVLGNHAFAGCMSLAKAKFSGDAPSLPGSDPFYGTSDDFVICYDEACRGWDGEYWSKYRLASTGDIGELPSETEKPTPSPEVSPEPDTTYPPMKPQESENPEIPPVSEGENGNTASVSSVISDDTQTTRQEKISENSGNVSDKRLHVNKVKIQKCKLKKQVLKITLKKDKKVSGYEVFYRKGKKGKFRRKSQKGWKKNQITLRGLKKNSCYYIKARAYKVVGGKKYYSAFTSCRRIKVK